MPEATKHTLKHRKKYALILASIALGYASSFAQSAKPTQPVTAPLRSPITVKPSTTRHGPEKGSLLIIGGNVGPTPAIWNKFTELAGGKEKAKLAVVTTASGDSAAFGRRFHSGLLSLAG